MPAIDERALAAHRTQRRAVALALFQVLSTSILVGAAAGFSVGGLLGRLAMRLLTLTSPDELRGRITDDAAVVGRFSVSGSLSLALFTALLGIFGGLGYALAMRVLPASALARVLAFSALSTCVGGALLLHDHPSFDFSELQPTWLAAMLFLLLPALFGALVAAGVDWAQRPESWVQRLPPRARIIAASVISLPVLPFVLAAAMLSLIVRLNSRLYRFWSSSLVTYLGLAIYGLLIAWGLYGVASDIFSMATDEPSRVPLTL